jgi:hypothetical protein
MAIGNFTIVSMEALKELRKRVHWPEIFNSGEERIPLPDFFLFGEKSRWP